MISILFVCAGNICRSPALSATMQSLVKKRGLSAKFHIDSCGIHTYFLNSRADPSMQDAAQKRGISIESRAKVWSNEFFNLFDWIFVVDTRILKMLKSAAKSQKMASKVHLATEFSSKYPSQDIPDPYMGGQEGFDHVMNIIEDACGGILKKMEVPS